MEDLKGHDENPSYKYMKALFGISQPGQCITLTIPHGIRRRSVEPLMARRPPRELSQPTSRAPAEASSEAGAYSLGAGAGFPVASARAVSPQIRQTSS